MLGLYNAAPKDEFVPGLEVAGVVEAVGADVAEFAVGARVYALTRFGGYTTHLEVAAEDVRALPDGWTFEQGCGFPVQALTAIYALKTLGNCSKGQVVLVHSAAGGVGLLALQVLRHYGASAICTVSSADKVDFLADTCHVPRGQIILRTGGGAVFKAQLQAALATMRVEGASPPRAPEGVDLVLDSLGGDYFQPGYDLLARGGRIVVFGSGSMMVHGDLGANVANWVRLGYRFMTRPMVDPMELVGANKAILGFNLIWLWDKRALLVDLLRELQEMALEPPVVGHRYAWAELPAAVRFFQTGRSIGKVVVTVP